MRPVYKRLFRLKGAIGATRFNQGDFGQKCGIKETRMSAICCGKVRVKRVEKETIERLLAEELGENWREKVGAGIWESF